MKSVINPVMKSPIELQKTLILDYKQLINKWTHSQIFKFINMKQRPSISPLLNVFSGVFWFYFQTWTTKLEQIIFLFTLPRKMYDILCLPTHWNNFIATKTKFYIWTNCNVRYIYHIVFKNYSNYIFCINVRQQENSFVVTALNLINAKQFMYLLSH